MLTLVRILGPVLDEARESLNRPHAFALERVGFLFGRSDGGSLTLLSSFAPVADEDYEPDERVAARINAHAISVALQQATCLRAAAFHVHIHPHRGMPHFSSTDLRELPDVMKPFAYVVPDEPRGLLVMSDDSLYGVAWYPGDPARITLSEFSIVGRPMRLIRGSDDRPVTR